MGYAEATLSDRSGTLRSMDTVVVDLGEETLPHEMNDAFGHWLAGFIDGEGCFVIAKREDPKYGARYQCRFSVNMRADERPMLEEIVARTHIGRIEAKKADRKSRRGNPQAVWMVTSQRECLMLVELLDRYPLRAKKRRDYTIWREAVILWCGWAMDNPRHFKRDWRPLGRLRERLMDGRRYREAVT